MADGGSITYSFKGDTKDIKSKLESVASTAKSAAGVLGTAFVAGVGVAVGAVTKLTKQSLEAYSEYEQLEGGLESLFGKGSKEVERVMKTSEEAYKNVTMSQNEYLNAFQNTYSIMKNGMSEQGDAIEYTNKMIQISSDLYNTYGGSVENYSNAINWALKGTYSYIDNLNIGIKGTKEGFIEAANESGILNRQIKDTSELTNDEIIDVIQHYTEAAGAFGRTEAEASETIQGSMNMAKSSWSNLIAGFGKDGADLGGLVNEFIESAEKVLENIYPVLERILDGLLVALPKLINQIAKQLPTTIQKLLPPLIEGVKSVIQGIVSAIPTLLNVLIEALPSVLQALIDMFFGILNALIEIIPTLIPQLVEVILDGILTILDNIDLLVDTGIQLLYALIDGIVYALPILWEKAPLIIIKIVGALVRNLPKIATLGLQLLAKLWSGMSKAIPGFIKKIPTIIKNIVTSLKGELGKIKELGTNLIKGLWDGIKDKVEWVKEKISKMGKAILKAIKKVFGVSSPSKEFAVIGRFNMMGLEKGMEEMQPEVQKSIDGMFNLSPSLTGGMNTLSPNVNVVVNNNMELDPLGQVVSKIKTFSGGAKNDFNYGQGV